MKTAKYWDKTESWEEKKEVKCSLCPNRCIIQDGKLGSCNARKNISGTLVSLSYSHPVSIHVDPVEKKPLYHFMPNTNTLSFGTAGCNLHCKHCQNYDISQVSPEESKMPLEVFPETIVQLSIDKGCDSLSYTYTEPTIFFEYMIEIAQNAKSKGIKSIMVTNGYIEEKPAKEISKWIDAANIDIKSFDNSFYKEICSGTLKPVLRTAKIFKENNVHIEITNLILDKKNDNMEDIEKLCIWIKENLGENTPLHFSKATPMYKMQDIIETPKETLLEAYNVAKKHLKYVYIGNIQLENKSDTFCPKCDKKLIERNGYTTTLNISDNSCECGQRLPIVLKKS